MTRTQRKDRCEYLYHRMTAAYMAGNIELAEAYCDRLRRHWQRLIDAIAREEVVK